ncbi:hypothetical protein Bpfe_005900 [Biomphalaria pfeifferi]|uniref:Ig-like domain-containing protein n=1 Tax=Biomphalaria pfeifferi TaxID=112525 RepID=A0AAD8C1J0_BIOPF|nr:hypothetical protein Bpfe_005900 [Biomphalaria pfeifferi]
MISIVGVTTKKLTPFIDMELHAEWTNISTVDVTCEVVVDTFSLPITFTMMAILRETSSETRFSKIVSLIRSSIHSTPRISSFFPSSEPWAVSFENDVANANITSLKLLLQLTEFECKDTGDYKCITVVNNRINVTQIDIGDQIIFLAPISINLNFTPQMGDTELESINDVGDNVTFTCTVTGPPTLKIVWKSIRLSSDKKEYNLSTRKNQSSGTTDCTIHTTVFNKTLEIDDNGIILYCIVRDTDNNELSKKNFTIWLKGFQSHITNMTVPTMYLTANVTANLTAHFRTVASTVKQSLAMILSICICKTFVTD